MERPDEELRGDDNRHLRAAGDKMLDIIDRLRAAEKSKHHKPIGSDGFLELAEEAARLSRLAFRWSQVQLQLAQQAAANGGDSQTMTDIKPRPLDRILADWREAQLRLEIASPGSEQAQGAANDVERLREEFHAAREEHSE